MAANLRGAISSPELFPSCGGFATITTIQSTIMIWLPQRIAVDHRGLSSVSYSWPLPSSPFSLHCACPPSGAGNRKQASTDAGGRFWPGGEMDLGGCINDTQVKNPSEMIMLADSKPDGSFDGNMNRGIPKNGHQIATNAGRVPCLLTDMPRRCFGNSSLIPSTSDGGGVGTTISRSTLRKASETQLPSGRPVWIHH